MDSLIDDVDVVDIVTPTIHHFECAKRAIEKGRHVFIEKPVTTTVQQAEELMLMLAEKGLKAQVGHVERFNPAFTAVRPHIKNPAFIEATASRSSTRAARTCRSFWTL